MFHPPYSCDLTPSDCFLFPHVKIVLKRKHFANVEEVNQKMAEALKCIKINTFKNCFEQWKKEGEGINQSTRVNDPWTWITGWGLTVGVGGVLGEEWQGGEMGTTVRE